MTKTQAALATIAATNEYRDLRWSHGGNPIGDIVYESAGQDMYDGSFCDLARRLGTIIRGEDGAHNGASRLERQAAAASILAMLPSWAREEAA